MSQAWFKQSVVYQVYPRSFCDSNGDGIGDLRGITAKLDYLQALGVDVVWLSPIYRSPNDDNGYDISDYRDVMAELGTMADFDALLHALHERGLKLVMDLVVNHSSDEHPWFTEACKGRDNPYRNYYIWRSPRDGAEPNNWASAFGGPAWTLHEPTGEYYLHLFSRKQPDLNWENPRLRQEVYALMRFWLDKGVDGFRMDVINMISKAPKLPDAPATLPQRPWQPPGPLVFHGPRLAEFLDEMKREVLSHYDLITVGEAPNATPEHGVQLTDEREGFLNMLFQFEHVDLDIDPAQGLGKWGRKPLELRSLKASMSRWQHALHGRGWNSLYLSNHDQPRPVSRFGDEGAHRVASAKMLATFLHLLQGTPYVYQGEELGMTNVRFGSIDEYRDIETLNLWREAVDERGMAAAQVLDAIHAKGRDNARTPMQWSDGPQAGFTTGTPWIGVNPNYREVNARQALADPDSVFHHYRRLIALRRALPVVVHGRYELLLPEHAQIYAYLRTLGEERLLVVCNFSRATPRCELPADLAFEGQELLIANYPVEAGEDIRAFTLRPYEARAYRLH
ncbi:glycoside hydrolase family 13 protein [Azohydromonas lata]|uniref:glycoside hydrolase family 13 protein n=1 Tax=Azohydromonas lata TaxID=45677 RepID=UPI00082CF0C0|nr:alpha-glucosidase [Azohydromonas lata]